jgi:hypothetical protein
VALASLPITALPFKSLAQDAGPEPSPYCAGLKLVTTLALAKERFASITGKPREGNFIDTTLTLDGWSGCSLYGATTFTCDSARLDSAAAAEKMQTEILQGMKTCLGAAWSETAHRSSPNYVVLHHAARPVSITLSTDQTDDKQHVVRLIVFVRRN